MPTASSLLVDCRATLGECLVWSVRQQVWYWTDIERAHLWRHVPSTGSTRSWTLPDRCGSFALCQSGRVLLGLAKGLAWARIDDDAKAATCVPIVDVEPEQPTTRINDGRTDRDGHFVFGTMNESAGHSAIGHIYQFSVRHGLRRLDLDPVGIANSICFSPDGSTMYFCDLVARRIMQADYDAGAARVSHVRLFVDLPREQGMPDGSIVDRSGALWNAEWGGAAVRRYTANGVLMATSNVPADHVTCPAFGGPQLDELCVTTARSAQRRTRFWPIRQSAACSG